MGRGRAKAKQTKVARNLKYQTLETDFDQLQRELHGEPDGPTEEPDPELLEKLSLSGKPALLAVIVRIDEVFLHCARAMLRAKLWDATTYPKHELVPSMRDMHAELVSIDVPADAEAGKRELYREYLY